ncbi:MAG: hypothetical protein ACP5NE_01005 [Candidatus Micrarchaeia archaeon]
MAKHKARSQKRQKKNEGGKSINTLPLYIIILLLFIFYIMFQRYVVVSAFAGIALFLVIITTIAVEMGASFKEEGVKKSVLELSIAVVIVIVFWFGLKIVLGTQYPLNVVPTCSMLPVLHRGDLVVISGVTSAAELKAPIVNISSAEWNTTMSNFGTEFLECAAYNASNETVSSVFKKGDELVLFPTSGYNRIIDLNQQGNNLIKYGCGVREVKASDGTSFLEAYTDYIKVGNTTIEGDRNNSIVVYKTVPQDYFYRMGDTYIVHRIYAIINASGTYYVLTKGDNNPGLDIQFGNYPILLQRSNNYVEGKVIFVAPYIGYLRLIFSRQLSEPQGCNTTITHG